MREIKFRAWDGNRYISHDSLCCPSYSLGEILYGSGFIVEQFTGLYDKNGREIYEGDVVVTDYGTGPVEYSGVGFSVDCDSISEYWETSQSTEVIGNIHENPELLND